MLVVIVVAVGVWGVEVWTVRAVFVVVVVVVIITWRRRSTTSTGCFAGLRSGMPREPYSRAIMALAVDICVVGFV